MQEWTQIRDFAERPLSSEEARSLLSAAAELPPALAEKARLLHVEDTDILNCLRAEVINDLRQVPFGLLTLVNAQVNVDGDLVPVAWDGERTLRQLIFEESERLGLVAYQRGVYPSAWYTRLVREKLALAPDWLPMYFVFVGAPLGFGLDQEYFELKQKRTTHGENWID